MSHENSELTRDIREAFRNVTAPEVTLRRARACDDYTGKRKLSEKELTKLDRVDRACRNWWEIPPSDLETFADTFVWLDDDGRLFYLPAYMTLSLRQNDYGKLWLGWYFGENSITPRDNRNYLSHLSPEQKSVVLRFLRAVPSTVKGDYQPDWWNHPWDPAWSEDQKKERFWTAIGTGYTFLTGIGKFGLPTRPV